MTIVDRLLQKIDERFEILTERIENGKQEFTSCKECAFFECEEWEMPCKECKHNCKDYYKRKNHKYTRKG